MAMIRKGVFPRGVYYSALQLVETKPLPDLIYDIFGSRNLKMSSYFSLP